jgi:hypothetical protein
MPDIVLVVIAAVSQLATAGIGVWVSLKQGPRRVPLAIACLALAVTGMCATAWTGLRSRATGAVPTTVERSPTPRESRASIRVTTREVTMMGVGQLVKVSIGFENSGDRPVIEVHRVQMVNFILSPYGEEEAFRLLRAELQHASGESESVAPAGRLSFTIDGPRLIAGDFLPRGSDELQVVRDGRPLLVAGMIRYQADDRSEATAEYCFYAMNAKVLVACSGHNT